MAPGYLRARRLAQLTLEERVTALAEELEYALHCLAIERREACRRGGPEGVAPPPLQTFRNEIDAAGFGKPCLCRAYLAAKKEG